MNPLQEYTHLFANGKFKVRWNHKKADYVEDVNLGAEPWFLSTPDVINNCTLIARPISDMSDEECQWFIENDPTTFQTGDIKGVRDWLAQAWESQTLNADELLQLLSIRVYFGPQSHFEDGTVINEAEIRNKMG